MCLLTAVTIVHRRENKNETQSVGGRSSYMKTEINSERIRVKVLV